MAAPRIDPDVFEEIALYFLESKSATHDDQVVASYGELERQTNTMFAKLSRSIRIAFTRCRAPYSSDAELIRAVRTDKVLEVTASCVSSDSKHPMLNSDLGGAYDQFRAVHDISGHAMLNVGFDRQGEFETWLHQDRYYKGRARLALATELHGRNSVLCTTGDFAEPKAILLDARLLARSRRGLPN